jgi:ACR3 family arsenite transporter
VIQVAIPLRLYFLLMGSIAFAVGTKSGLDCPRTCALAFTAVGNNFELAIAVCINIWGVTSQQALAGVISPLIEVPVLVALVYVSLWLKARLFADSSPS